MPGPYDLSFCIPTYNFADFLPQTLESIVSQADDRVQIVIVDGASTDNTPEVVREWQRRFPHIKYIRRPARCGVDPDILESVKQADGEYCWLFSADDILAPHAIELIRSEMRRPWDVWLTNFALCDRNMRRSDRHRILALQEPTTFDWNQTEERRAYLDLAETTTAFFSFISGIVVRRAAWMRVPEQSEFIGSCWIIAAQIFALVDQGLVVRYHPGEALSKRGDNDSFMTHGLIRRIDLAVTGFRRVAHRYFGPHSPESRAVSRTLRTEFPPWFLAHQRMRLPDPADVPVFHQIARNQFSDGNFTERCWGWLLQMPLPVLRAVRQLHTTFNTVKRVVRRMLLGPAPTHSPPHAA
jgi:abequosyltransferase